MESLIVLLKSLLFLSAAVLAVDKKLGNDNSLIYGSLSKQIVPVYYEVHLELHDTYSNISSRGECKITIWIQFPTKTIIFYVDRSQVQKLHCLTMKSTEGVEEMTFKPTLISYNNETNMCMYSFDKELIGYYKLHLTFMNVEDSNKGSFFRTSFANDKGGRTWLVATDLWPMGARRLFPCWDEPQFQASFRIIIKHPKSHRILSNMPQPEKSLSTEQPNVMETYFEKTPLIPTYHFSVILLSDFLGITRNDVIIEYRKELNFINIKFTLNALDKIIRYFQWQLKPSLKHLRHIVTPNFRRDVISNFGLIFYREDAIIFDEDPFVRQIDITRLLGRAVAYQCLSKRIGPSSWSHMWLNQAISILLAMDAIDENFPEYGIKDLFVVQTLQESLRLDTQSIMKPLVPKVHSPSDIDSTSFSFACYIKGPVILRMLQQMLRIEVFRYGISTYLSHNSSYAGLKSIDAFWFAMQAAYEDNKYGVEHLNVKQIMDIWLTQEHYPVIKVSQNNPSLITVTAENMSGIKKWWIPYTATIEDEPEFSLLKHTMRYMATENDSFIYLETNKWVIVNLQQIGYFRVNYDAQSLQKITNYLNSDEYSTIHVVNRAQIIDDAFHFLIIGQLDLSAFVKHTTHLLLDGNYTAWYPMFKAFEYMSSILPFEKGSFIKSRMLRILDEHFLKLKYEENNYPNFVNGSLKQEIARWACAFGSFECRSTAYLKLKRHLMQKEYLLPWWREWTYCNGLRVADDATWYKVLNVFSVKLDYSLLKFLACSENFRIIRKYLEIIKTTHETKMDTDQIYIFHSIVARYAQNDIVLDYILKNLYKLKPKAISITVALINIINHVYSNSSLDKISKFLKRYLTWPTGIFYHPIIDEGLYNKIMTCTRNISGNRMKEISNLIILGKMFYFKNKIELRSSEIMQHENHFRNLFS